jgi:hypothetical protein
MMIDYLDQETLTTFSALIERAVQNGIVNKTLKPRSVEDFRALAWKQVDEALYNNTCESVLKGLENMVKKSAIAT